MLKVCSWNVNGGMLDVIPYMEKRIFPDFDIVCVQEIHSSMSTYTDEYMVPRNPNYPGRKINAHLFQQLQSEAGVEFESYFAPQMTGLHDRHRYSGVQYGNAIFVRKTSPVVRFTSGMVYGKYNQLNTERQMGTPAGKSGQVVTIAHEGTLVTIGHFHGFWSQEGKVDMADRLVQNKGVEQLFAQHVSLQGQAPNVLLLGDFNYTSKMQALQNLVHTSFFGHTDTRKGGIHLNEQYAITDTRTPQYIKEVREADHAIASFALAQSVLSCEVDSNVPSDHAVLSVRSEL